MLEDALEVATDPNYKFDLAIQLGRLDIAKVCLIVGLMTSGNMHVIGLRSTNKRMFTCSHLFFV